MKKGLAILLIILLGGSIYFALKPETKVDHQPVLTTPQVVKPEPKPANVEDLLKYVNEERAKVGAHPLVIDPRMNQSAQRKAVDMDTHKYLEHISPIDGRQGYTYITDAGVRCRSQGENIRVEDDYDITLSDRSAQAIRLWMLSTEGHREAIQNPRFDTTGFGISGRYMVQHFCDL